MSRLVVAAVLLDSLAHPTQVLAARRSRPADLAGLWEFPGGKVEPGETPQAALAREIREELGIDLRVGAGVGTWPISDDLHLQLFLAEITGGDLTPGETHDAVRWLTPGDLTTLPWLPADAQALTAVTRAIASQP